MGKLLVAKPFAPYPYALMIKYGGLHHAIAPQGTKVNIPKLNVC